MAVNYILIIIRYENPDEKPVSFYFYTRTRIMAFIQHENEVMNLAAEMQNITQQKPVLCLESHTVNTAMKICRENTVQIIARSQLIGCDINSGCSDKYEADYCCGYSALETNIGYAIDAAWTWFHTGFVNNFISKDPETNLLHLNWYNMVCFILISVGLVIFTGLTPEEWKRWWHKNYTWDDTEL